MNQIVNKLFMSEMHLRQPGFTHSACGPFTKNKKRIQKLIQADTKKYKKIQIIFTRMNWIKLVFNMMWFMANTKA